MKFKYTYYSSLPGPNSPSKIVAPAFRLFSIMIHSGICKISLADGLSKGLGRIILPTKTSKLSDSGETRKSGAQLGIKCNILADLLVKGFWVLKNRCCVESREV